MAAETALPSSRRSTGARAWTPARLRRRGRLWTLTTARPRRAVPAHRGALLMLVEPLAFAVAASCLAHAWIIPALYAQRGGERRAAEVAQRRRAGRAASRRPAGRPRRPRQRASCTRARASCSSAARLGVWLVGTGGRAARAPRRPARPTAGACASTTPTCPRGDRIAHLLLALRTDEDGFATVANLAFSGARWRVRRRMDRRHAPGHWTRRSRAARPNLGQCGQRR